MNETKEEYDQRIADARKALNERDERAKIHNVQIVQFSTEAMKAPTLVAAGGVAAALGFYSANFSHLSKDPANLAAFNDILFYLFLSLLFSVMAPGAAYFSQAGYWKGIYAEKFDWESPHLRETKKSKTYEFLGDVSRWLAVALVSAAIISLMMGGWRFLHLVNVSPI